jgi:hypothetical protein
MKSRRRVNSTVMFLSPRQRRLQAWEQIRTKGKLRFVIETSVRWALPLIIGLPLMFLFLNMITLRQMVIFMIVYLVIVPVGALVEWWKNEGTYVAAELDKRMDVLKRD